MRRLFSTFASGAPGAGLLLLRVAGAAIFIVDAAAAPWRMAEFPALLLHVTFLGLGLLLVAGMWTPLVATLAAVAALLMGYSHPAYWLVAAICAALALLGPGAWSVDARLFGWKRIDIDTEGRQGRRHS